LKVQDIKIKQTPFETFNYIQQTMFETAFSGEKLHKQKIAQNVAISLVYFISQEIRPIS